jgi:phage terminase large subunit-like protein
MIDGNEITKFIENNIPLNEKGQPWSLSDYQRVILVLMYARHYAIRLWSEIKKSGKTFLAACIGIAEAILNPDSEVVVISNDKDQAKSRVFRTMCQLIEKNEGLRSSARVLTDEIRFTNGSLIKAVSKDFRGEAGGRQRLTIGDEIWGFDNETAVRFFEEMTPPPTEDGAYILITSYAGYSNEGQLLENLYQRGLKGKRIHRKYEVYRADGLCMFWSHTPRQPWQLGVEGRAYYAEQKRILRPNTFRRLHRNEWVSSEGTFILPEAWDSIVDKSITPMLSGGALHLGIDIGVKNDSTGVVGVVREGDKVRVALHRCWKPWLGHPVNLDSVEEYISGLKQNHSIVGAFADPSQCLMMIQRLAAKGVIVQEFPQTISNCVQMGQTLYTLVTDKNLIAYENAELKEHITNAVAQETDRGLRMVKGTTRKKIDLGIALAMACVSAIQGPMPLDLTMMRAFGSRTARVDRDWLTQRGEYEGEGLHPMDVLLDDAKRGRHFDW